MQKIQYTQNFTVENMQKDEKKSNPRLTIIEYPKLLFYILSEYKNVSKIAKSLKQILKWKLVVFILLKKIPTFKSGFYR